LLFFRIPFPELKDLDSLASVASYNAHLAEYLKNALVFDTRSCFESGKLNLPATNK
jgi:hypothetical protein